jgi:hypothetical protein
MNKIDRAVHNAIATRIRSMIPEDHEFEGQGLTRTEQREATQRFENLTWKLATDLERQAQRGGHRG